MINPWHLISVVLAAAMAFAVSITYVLVLNADGTRTVEKAGTGAQAPQDRTNCDEIYGTAYRSDSERTWFTDNCSAWSKAVGEVPEPSAAPTPQRSQPNPQPSSPPPAGRDCNQIRGTPYRSAAERDWYLANCIGDQNQQTATAAGDRSDCNQIRGTPYRSDAEREWYGANCLGLQQVASSGPDRTNCDEINGTPYRSDNERRWYLANCRPH